MVAGLVCAQEKQYRHKPFLRGVELGFYGRTELGFLNHKPARLQFKQPEMFIRLPLSRHWKAEVSINRQQFFSGIQSSNADVQRVAAYNSECGVTMPASIQYYFLNPSSKVRPFVGMGGWLFATSRGGAMNCTNPESRQGINSGYRGPNFISVFYTQGITIEVNTHLQITQSIHFYNQGDAGNVEMTVGIGYRLP